MTEQNQQGQQPDGAGNTAGQPDGGQQQKDAAYWEAEAKKAFADRDALKAKAKENAQAAARLKEIEDAQKSETQKLTEERDALKTKATRAEALEAEVQALFDEATKDLTDAQKAVIVGSTPEEKLRHFRALQAAGLIGQPSTPQKSPGGQLPGRGGGNTMKAADFYALPLGGPFEAAEKRRKAGELVLVH